MGQSFRGDHLHTVMFSKLLQSFRGDHLHTVMTNVTIKSRGCILNSPAYTTSFPTVICPGGMINVGHGVSVHRDDCAACPAGRLLTGNGTDAAALALLV